MSISNHRSLLAMRIASCIFVFCTLSPQAHAAAACDAGTCSLSETGLPEVAQALLQKKSDASRKPATGGAFKDKAKAKSDHNRADEQADPAAKEDMDARKAVTKSVIKETLAPKVMAASLEASKKVEEQQRRVEESVKEKNQAAQAVLGDLQAAKADADENVEKNKREATKVAAKKLEQYRLALQKATAERVATEKVLANKHAAESDALQKFAVVQTIMEQSAISDVDTDAGDAKAKKRKGKHARQVGDANTSASDAAEDQDPRAAPEDNAKGNASAKNQPTALDAKAKKRNGKYVSKNRKLTSVSRNPAAVQQKTKKSKPASTSWFS